MSKGKRRDLALIWRACFPVSAMPWGTLTFCSEPSKGEVKTICTRANHATHRHVIGTARRLIGAEPRREPYLQGHSCGSRVGGVGRGWGPARATGLKQRRSYCHPLPATASHCTRCH